MFLKEKILIKTGEESREVMKRKRKNSRMSCKMTERRRRRTRWRGIG